MTSRPAAALLAALTLATACVGVDPAARQGPARAAYRGAHREYDGAPPVIPHPVTALGRQDCLNCHRDGTDLGQGGIAPRTPHPDRVDCRQCHVEQLEPRAVFVKNDFDGLRYPSGGTRAYPGAPPTMPHPRNGREGCLGCHGQGGGSPMRTPHPERVVCLQCHVEQVPGAALYRVNAFGGSR